MRVLSRFALVAVVLSLAAPLAADHFVGQCPLSLADSAGPTSRFDDSPHGVFTSGNQVFVLRGNTITTFTRNDAGQLTSPPVRADQLGSLGAREVNGGVTFNSSNNRLFLSSEAGFEVFDLSSMGATGTGPAFVSRTPNLHYRRLAVSGNMVAGLYPATDLPCAVNPPSTRCFTNIDLLGVGSPQFPSLITSIPSLNTGLIDFNDVAFARGFLVATGDGGTWVLNIANPFQPTLLTLIGQPGTFLATNGSNLVAIGLPGEINLYSLSPEGILSQISRYTLAPYLTIDRANPVAFHPQMWIDDANGRLVTMVDEIDPLTRQPARTIAFDIFDVTVPQYEGSAPRPYEALTFVPPDEVKFNPVVVGPYVYTVGERSGVQLWGACDQITGAIEWNSIAATLCGGSDVHGWVTGTEKIANVEVFFDNVSKGFATLTGPLRADIDSRTPAVPWHINLNLDDTAAGEHTLRVVGTDVAGNIRQFGSQTILFPGAPNNCVPRRGRAIRAH
jgi:hypothetical protein